MRPLLATAIATLAQAIAGQDFIHYRFDSNCSLEVINYATGSQALASNGALQSNSSVSPYTAGRFGGGLAGGSPVTTAFYNRVVSGWDPSTQPVSGDVTIAWFMRLRPGATFGSSVSYLMGAPSGGFRLFTGGAAGAGLIQRETLVSGGNSSVRDFVLPATATNVQALAAANWLHVAIVVDSTTTTATWFVNGNPAFQLNNVPGALIVQPGSFTIGAWSLAPTGPGSPYDLDEFLLSRRAFSAAEILLLSLAPRAGHGGFTSGIPSQCGAGNLALGSTGGAPNLGNAGYALSVTAVRPSLLLVLAGFDRCSFGGSIPLPLDGTPLLPLLNGCWILTDTLAIVGVITNGGPTSLPFPIPGSPTNLGLTVYFQSLALDLASGASSMSNGFAVGIGL
ncbi:MAG: LamG-like jellyroll fold domain-containing protein [Planctomycetota bacterium]